MTTPSADKNAQARGTGVAGRAACGESEPAIEARDLVKAFGLRRALDGVDLTLPAGSFLTVFGPNGAGKTTLLRILATLSKPTRGTCRILGEDVATGDVQKVRARLGMISHKSMVYGDLTARENLAFAARLYGVADVDARVRELLELVELDHRANDCARTFSRGMTQRLSIARALVGDPELMLLDEPYAGLDPHGMRLLDELVERIRPGRTFVMVSHDLERGYALCTHALILARGRVVRAGRREDLDAGEFRETYLSCVGSLTSDVEAAS